MYLLDSSVWIEVFRAKHPLRLESIVELEEIATCLPVIQEVLQGFRTQDAYRVAREAIFSFPVIESPMHSEVFLSAIELYRSARRAGLTVRSGVDCLIAACALRNGLTVVHKDRDFGLLARVSELQVKNL